ncbi:MAG TPA: hypothetical protein VGG23_08295 [Acidimicrobiales bacterium]
MVSGNTGALVLDEVAGGSTMDYTQIGGLGPEWQLEGDGAFLGNGNTGFLMWDGSSASPEYGALSVGEYVGGTALYTQIGAIGPEWQFEGNGALLGQSSDDFLLWDGSSASPEYGSLTVGSVVDGEAQYSQIGSVGPEWEFAGVGDYLGDGGAAFLMENSTTAALVVGEDVNGAAQYTAVGALGADWQFEGSGDLLGPGQADFLVWNSSSASPQYGALDVGEVTNGAVQYTQVGSVGPAWEFLGVGNYDGASASEFLMKDTGTGALVIGTVAGGAATYQQVGGVGSEWNFHSANPATLV